MARILIADDEANMRRILFMILAEEGHEVVEASGVTEALDILAQSSFDLVITDKKMPPGDGIEIIEYCRENLAQTPVVMLTAFSTVELAVEAMQAGAFDFISKPFVPEVVSAVAKRATERSRLLRENVFLREEVRRHSFSDVILGESKVIVELREKIAKAAPTNASILILGETGTGKELVARSIHKGSTRAKGNFLAVNCAAVSETLLESELFGHEKGAFTGADSSRQGLFESASNGTLFLDEAAEMTSALQAKLLRVLNDGQIIRVGATVPRKVDVRIIAATHKNLEKEIEAGNFREDLFYRLAVVPLRVPALRERREDIPLLVDFLLSEIARELKVPRISISNEAVDLLMKQDFRGNVRELRNVLERAAILCNGERIEVADLNILRGFKRDGDWLNDIPRDKPLPEVLENIEMALVKHALNESDGVQARAARLLGISRSDIAYKIKKYELS
ncbi:MAG: sigma-54-dependent transcriptional regulator [Pyrinomonadaceae bacterium]